jgi:hypothetical protein
MSMVKIEWHPKPRELRKFGITLIVGFGLIGAAFWFGWPFGVRPAVALGLWIGGGAAGLLGLTGTPAALPLYWAWMGFAFVAGNVMSRVVLTLFYFLVMTPVGLFMRLIGRDKLGLRRRSAATYWVDLHLPDDPSRYERQF